MNISIKPYQASIPTKVPVQENLRSDNSAGSPSEDAGSGTAATVSISSAARARYIQSSAVGRQASMSNADLKGLYTKGQHDLYNFGQLIAGGNYNKEDLLPKTDDPNRLALGQQSLDYSIGLSQRPPRHVPNPFAGMARNDLSAIVYGDSGTYTMAERYAAYGELFRQDQAYFSSLAAKITNGGDNREFFKSVLDYFDDLPPVEKAAYPDGYRDNIDSLYQEQLDLWGQLASIKQPAEEDSGNIFDQGQSPQEMLQAILQKTMALSTAQ